MPQFTGSTFLGQLVIPEIWAQYINNDSTQTNRLLTSGIVTSDDEMGAHLQDPGQIMNIPVLNDLDGDPQDWNDTEDIKVSNITSDKHNAIKMYQAKAFGQTDFSQQVSGAPVSARVSSRFSSYWNNQDERFILALLQNAFLLDDMKEAKSFGFDTPKDLSAGDFLAALARMGDVTSPSLNRLNANSATILAMREQNLISDVQPSVGGTDIQTYNGIPITEDDSIELGDDGTTTMYINAPGAIRYSQAPASKNAVEVVRDALGKGGQDALINRRIVSMHVNGLGWDITKPYTGMTVNKLEDATDPLYQMVMDPRKIGVVAYKFKIDSKYVVKKINSKDKKGSTGSTTNTSTSGSTSSGSTTK
ncbi:capsid protein [Companilactobacillus nantensis]|uniref:Phage-related minor capsid protein (Gpg protein) n=1 Tax=Companilactobacillus nantensis DSM 16982 TaxID=1423774 RepID=A0A0R1WM08_9LACO|nr:capsid protein [Companilactobacillus nantensis]KRM17268.1 phage-related minor capsid protein (gpg protein) [Companilactobacillus nantensis DSM 16982]GEO64005.1 hypothetical protein LNA01_11880 [Companilactobacillus nantensis]